MNRPSSLFVSYAHEDAAYAEQFLKHLATFRRQGIILSWSQHCIAPGATVEHEVDSRLAKADIIVVIVSADFLASDYCHEVELRKSLARHAEGSARVVPIIARPSSWRASILGHLQPLPTDDKPISTWQDKDQAWTEIAGSIEQLARELSEGSVTVVENMRLRVDLAEASARAQTASQRCAQLEGELAALRAASSKRNADPSAQVALAVQDLASELSRSRGDIDSLRSALTQTQQERDNALSRIVSLTSALKQRDSDLSQLRRELKSANIHTGARQARLHAALVSCGEQRESLDTACVSWHFRVRNTCADSIRLIGGQTTWLLEAKPSDSFQHLRLQEPEESNFGDAPILARGKLSDTYKVKFDLRSIWFNAALRQAQVDPATVKGRIVPLVRIDFAGVDTDNSDHVSRLLPRHSESE